MSGDKEDIAEKNTTSRLENKKEASDNNAHLTDDNSITTDKINETPSSLNNQDRNENINNAKFDSEDKKESELDKNDMVGCDEGDIREGVAQPEVTDDTNKEPNQKCSPNITEKKVDKNREIRQRRYINRREEKIEKQREYYSKNRERMVEKQADYYKANREEVIARQYEYYQKNKSKITEKKRQWYQEKRGFVSNKRVVHPSLIDSISLEGSTKEGCGKVKIKHLKPIIQKFNNETNKKWKVMYDIRSSPDFISNCSVENVQLLKPGESKLDSLSDNQDIMTLPPGYSYRAKPLAASELLYVDSFLAMSISKDEESLDLRYLLHKDNISFEGMRDLFHAIQSVLDVDMYDFITEKQSLFFINPTCLSNPVLKNRFCKQVSYFTLYQRYYYSKQLYNLFLSKVWIGKVLTSIISFLDHALRE